MSVLEHFRFSPPKGSLSDPKAVSKAYSYWRIRIFYSMYIGYTFYYFTRQSFGSATLETMRPFVSLSKIEYGMLGSILFFAYGVSKFLSGVISDRSNPRYFMALGLMLTGVCNIFFGLSSSFYLFAILWGLNGFFQGWGWPPCAKLLRHWYSQSERGRWWSACSTSHNLGGAIIPVVATFLATQFGWQYAMIVPGVLCIGVGLFLINRLRDTPSTLNLPPVERFRNESEEVQESEREEQAPLAAKEILFKYVINNKAIWLLAAAYFFVYVIRGSFNVWIQMFLYEVKGLSLLKASTGIFWFEAGGFCGSLAAGWISDTIFGTRRGPVNILFAAGIGAALAGIWFMPANNLLIASFWMFASGFLIFGPQMLVGMAAVEIVHRKAAGTANGFVGCIAYLGAASAGVPIGSICQTWGWEGVFTIVGICCVFCTLLLLPFWGAKKETTEQVTS